MIFRKKKTLKPEDEYPGIWNLRQKNKLDCINHFAREQSSIERERQSERSEKRQTTMRQWFKQKIDRFVESSLEFFDDQEVHYTDERKNG